MRLHVFLSHCGIASRRQAEKFIAEGLVRVNGKVISTQGCVIDPEKDEVFFSRKRVRLPAGDHRYFLFYKPFGVVTTLKDPHAKKTVYEFFKDISERLVPAGRLDKNSTGLLLMTNDGDLVHRLTHPRFGVEKSYRVLVKGYFSQNAATQLESGVVIEGKKTAPCRITSRRKRKDNTELVMILREGRKREIREMVKKAGSAVLSLKRIAYGPLKLGSLTPGQRRELKPAEIKALKKI